MKKRYLIVVVVFVLAAVLNVGRALAVGTQRGDDPGQPVVIQDQDAAQAADIALLANETGLSVESVERAILFQQAFGVYADELIARFPNQISAVWMEPVPNTKGHIQFVGEVPAEVTIQLKKRETLNSGNVILTANGLISMEDHVRRAELAAYALVDLRYQNHVAFFDPMRQVIRIELQLSEGASQPSKEDIAGAMQARLQAGEGEAGQLQGRAATIDMADLDLAILTGEGPLVTPDHSRGGNWLLDDGVRECTSGWSVSGPNGDGIITAGHCNGLNQFEEPGVTPYGMTYQFEVNGTGGDVEYHTTTHPEDDDFYSDATTIRDVTGTKSTSTMVGGSICVYGRSSNVRTCNHIVEATGVTATGGGVTVTKLVRTDSTSTTGGDSGGGWSVGGTAWGIHMGQDSAGKGYFTPAQQAESVLGVTIKR